MACAARDVHVTILSSRFPENRLADPRSSVVASLQAPTPTAGCDCSSGASNTFRGAIAASDAPWVTSAGYVLLLLLLIRRGCWQCQPFVVIISTAVPSGVTRQIISEPGGSRYLAKRCSFRSAVDCSRIRPLPRWSSFVT
jgi:hypothetical protein